MYWVGHLLVGNLNTHCQERRIHGHGLDVLLVEGLPFKEMYRLTTEQRIKIVQTYYENGRKIKNTFRALRDYFASTWPAFRARNKQNHQTSLLDQWRAFLHIRTPKLCVRVMQWLQLRQMWQNRLEHRPVIDRSNWTLLGPLCVGFCMSIFICTATKCN